MPSAWIRGEPFSYKCSFCNRRFPPPEDREPKEAMKEVWEAFQEHIGEEHPGEIADEGGCSAQTVQI